MPKDIALIVVDYTPIKQIEIEWPHCANRECKEHTGMSLLCKKTGATSSPGRVLTDALAWDIFAFAPVFQTETEFEMSLAEDDGKWVIRCKTINRRFDSEWHVDICPFCTATWRTDPLQAERYGEKYRVHLCNCPNSLDVKPVFGLGVCGIQGGYFHVPSAQQILETAISRFSHCYLTEIRCAWDNAAQ